MRAQARTAARPPGKAVAVLGGGGPPDAAGGYTLRGTVSDRLGNNIVHLVFLTLIIALVGWAAAAFAGRLVRPGPPGSRAGFTAARPS